MAQQQFTRPHIIIFFLMIPNYAPIYNYFGNSIRKKKLSGIVFYGGIT